MSGLVLWKHYLSSLVLFSCRRSVGGPRVTPAPLDSCQTSPGKITYIPMFFFRVIARCEAPSGRQWHFYTPFQPCVLWHSWFDKINPPPPNTPTSLLTSQPLPFPSPHSSPTRDYHLIGTTVSLFAHWLLPLPATGCSERVLGLCCPDDTGGKKLAWLFRSGTE